jgi:hypothetical protein
VLVAVTVLLAAALGGPAGAAPSTPAIGPERNLTADTSQQSDAASAFDGSIHLVVWDDYRGTGAQSDIYGGRVRSDGTLVDPGGFPIAMGAPDESDPAVAATGPGSFVVVWRDFRADDNGDIYAARVEVGSSVTVGPALRLSATAGLQGQPAVASAGCGKALVVWTDDQDGNSDIRGTRLGAAGVQGARGFPISPVDGLQGDPAVASTGDRYLVAWTTYVDVEPYDVVAARVGPGGAVLDPLGIPIAAGPESEIQPDVAFDGHRALVVWTDFRSSPSRIYGLRVDPTNGQVDPGTGTRVATTGSPQRDPAVAGGPAGFVVVWSEGGDRRRIRGGRITPEGTAVDLAGFDIGVGATTEDHPVVDAGSGRHWMTGYQHSLSATGVDVFVRSLTAAK